MQIKQVKNDPMKSLIKGIIFAVAITVISFTVSYFMLDHYGIGGESGDFACSSLKGALFF